LRPSLIATGAVLQRSNRRSGQTTFKSGVDLILIEATVLDKDGRPIADLQAKDFSIKLGGKTRTVAAAEYIPAWTAAGGGADSRPVARRARQSTPRRIDSARAQLGASDRTIILAVDVDNIRSAPAGTHWSMSPSTSRRCRRPIASAS
jgi:hypothetical protein